MKKWCIAFFCLTSALAAIGQSAKYYDRGFFIKFEVLELAQAFPSIGIGVEQKLSGHSVWISYHHGWDIVNSGHLNKYFSGDYRLHGIYAGYKKIFSSGEWEYFLELQGRYDFTTASVTNGVFYDIDESKTFLFDEGKYKRIRGGIFLTNGFELLAGNHVSIDFYGVLGVGSIDNFYDDVINPSG